MCGPAHAASEVAGWRARGLQGKLGGQPRWRARRHLEGSHEQRDEWPQLTGQVAHAEVKTAWRWATFQEDHRRLAARSWTEEHDQRRGDQLNGFASEVTRVAPEVGTGQLGAWPVPGSPAVEDLTRHVNLMAENLTVGPQIATDPDVQGRPFQEDHRRREGRVSPETRSRLSISSTASPPMGRRWRESHRSSSRPSAGAGSRRTGKDLTAT